MSWGDWGEEEVETGRVWEKDKRMQKSSMAIHSHLSFELREVVDRTRNQNAIALVNDDGTNQPTKLTPTRTFSLYSPFPISHFSFFIFHSSFPLLFLLTW